VYRLRDALAAQAVHQARAAAIRAAGLDRPDSAAAT
jgi:hypothetical protein